MSEKAKNIFERAGKTACETALGCLATYATIWDVDIMAALGIIGIATLSSLLFNIAMELPEDKYRCDIEELRAANDALRNK